MFWQPSDRSGAAERLTRPEKGESHRPTSIAPDGSRLLIDVRRGDDNFVQMLSLSNRQLTPFDVGPTKSPTSATFSPDGRWVLYQRTEENSGSAILYGMRGRLESVRVTTRPSFGFTKPESRSLGGIVPLGPQQPASYDTAPGGMLAGVAVAPESRNSEFDRRVNVVLHWLDDVSRPAAPR